MDWEKLYQDWLLCCNTKNFNKRLKIERQAGTLLENRKLKDVYWRYIENGTNEEKAGLARIVYWSLRSVDGENIEELINKVNCCFLTEFVNNQNINVRRCIILNLQVEAWVYPQELHSLIPKAIDIAMSHADEYIRHRIKIQLGYSNSYMALPD